MNDSPTLSAVEKLKAQRDKLNARIQMAESRNKNAERKQDTRRKILLGSYYLDKARTEGKLDELKNLMAGYLSRDSDRKLFDLPENELPEKNDKNKA